MTATIESKLMETRRLQSPLSYGAFFSEWSGGSVRRDRRTGKRRRSARNRRR